jgi:hypothetical protein
MLRLADRARIGDDTVAERVPTEIPSEATMAEPAKLTGPDFGAGVDASALRDGELLLGHANGEAVLLDGDAGEHDVTVRFMRGDKALAVTAIFRDRESLEAEMKMERS